MAGIRSVRTCCWLDDDPRTVAAGERTAWTGVPAGHKFNNVQTWDITAAVSAAFFGTGQHGLGWALPNVDQAGRRWLETETRGTLRRTLRVMVGEFGRSPKINPAG